MGTVFLIIPAMLLSLGVAFQRGWRRGTKNPLPGPSGRETNGLFWGLLYAGATISLWFGIIAVFKMIGWN